MSGAGLLNVGSQASCSESWTFFLGPRGRFSSICCVQSVVSPGIPEWPWSTHGSSVRGSRWHDCHAYPRSGGCVMITSLWSLEPRGQRDQRAQGRACSPGGGGRGGVAGHRKPSFLPSFSEETMAVLVNMWMGTQEVRTLRWEVGGPHSPLVDAYLTREPYVLETSMFVAICIFHVDSLVFCSVSFINILLQISANFWFHSRVKKKETMILDWNFDGNNGNQRKNISRGKSEPWREGAAWTTRK